MHGIAHDGSIGAARPGGTRVGIQRAFPGARPFGLLGGSLHLRPCERTGEYHGSGSPTTAGRVRIGALCGLAGLVAYCDFPIEGLTGSRLSPARAYVSELSVAGQPFSGVFRLSDLVAGVGLMVFAWTLGTWLQTARAWAAGRLLALAGTCAVVDGIWPMTNAPSTGRASPGLDLAGITSRLLQVHAVSGLVGFSSILIAMGLLSSVLQRRANARWLGPTGLAAVAVATTLGALEIGMDLAGVAWVGLAERVQLSTIGVWLGAVVFDVLRETQRPKPKAGPGQGVRRSQDRHC
jgi:uncharacterized protein DUF998